MAHDRYISPFSTRYASDEMQYTFSDDNKFRTWRRLWIALAKAEQKQGLDITDEQIAELEAHKDDINYEEAIAREKLVRHDVMSHVYAYGLQCPKAKGIIHLGATSCYVGDNTDVIIMREGLQLVRKKLIGVLANLADFAEHDCVQSRRMTFCGISVPGFYLGTAFIDLFAVRLGWISVSGNSGFTRYFPVALCLSVLGICFYGQMLAASLEREMEQDYAMYLRCRGLREGRILLFHAFPHAVVDLLPSFAQMLGLCLANAAIVERVFSLSGLGYLIIDAVVKRDSPVIHAAVLVLALTLVLLDTAAELLQYGLRSDMRAVGGRA